ncbi:MAG TPA: TonB family protein [Vicinamibacterales bacterium]|nr:TonB family protein [Vicinamibacterales bacterium]
MLDRSGGTYFEPGTMLGPFRIEGVLGKGGMATVYEAIETTALKRIVALKVLPPEFLHNDTFASRFTQEAWLAAGVEHQNVVPIYASGIDDGIPWMSMRRLDGSLIDLITPDGLGIERTSSLLRSVAEALDYAHAQGVVHRDLKPSNILLDRSDRTYLADFGLAILMEEREGLTRSGTIVGTPLYMAPEQGLGSKVDRRCDIYSLGVVAYEMLTGTTPFRGPSHLMVMMQHVNDPVPVPPRALVSEAHFDVLKKALAKEPEDRWQSAVEFVTALESGIRVRPLSSVVVKWAWVASSFVLGFWLLWQAAHMDPARPEPGRTTAPSVVTEVGQATGDSRLVQPTQPTSTSGDGGDAPSPRTPPSKPPIRGSSPSVRPDAPSPRVDDAPPTGARVDGDPPRVEAQEPTVEITVSPIVPNQVAEPPGLVITIPKRIKTVKPDYPRNAKAAKIEGDVLVEAVILPDGRVTKVRVLNSPNPALNDAAIKAVQQSTYTPGLRNGVPEEFTIQERVTFKLP